MFTSGWSTWKWILTLSKGAIAVLAKDPAIPPKIKNWIDLLLLLFSFLLVSAIFKNRGMGADSIFIQWLMTKKIGLFSEAEDIFTKLKIKYEDEIENIEIETFITKINEKISNFGFEIRDYTDFEDNQRILGMVLIKSY